MFEGYIIFEVYGQADFIEPIFGNNSVISKSLVISKRVQTEFLLKHSLEMIWLFLNYE